SLSIGDFVTIEGDVSFTSLGTMQAFAGTNLTVFLGQGPLKLPSGDLNPNATGVYISEAQIGLIKFADGSFAMNATGNISVIGVPGIKITGQATVSINTSGLSVNQTLTIPNSTLPGINIAFATGKRVTLFSGLNLELN